MGNELIAYLQQLEILAFFSGYPLLYALIAAFNNPKDPSSKFINIAFRLLPFAYAVVGTLHIGYVLKKFYPDYSFDRITSEVQIPFFVFWAISSLLFFIPLLSKKPIISLVHSLVFLYLLVKNFYDQLAVPETDKTVLKNHMNVYIDSILLNTTTLVSLLIIYYAVRFLRRKKGPVR